MGGVDSKIKKEINSSVKAAKYSKKITLEKLQLSKQAIQYLLASNLEHITELVIREAEFEESWVELFKSAKWKLDELNLSNNYMGPELGRYMKNANLEQLTVLNLSNNVIMAEGAKQIADIPFKRLSSLDLFGNNIRDGGFAATAKLCWTLRLLDVGNNGITWEGCRAISQTNWQNLVNLNLRVNNIGRKGCRYLKSSNIHKIEYLNLEFCNVQNEGCKWIAKAQWTELQYLFLGNQITNEGCKHLSRASWKRLSFLKLSLNDITTLGASYFFTSPLKALTSIVLDHNDQLEAYLIKQMKQRGAWIFDDPIQTE